LAAGTLERTQEAFDAFDRVTRLNPKNEAGWYNRALALWRLKQYKEAINSFEEVVRINPNNTDAQANIKRLQQQLKQQAASVA
jgi:tetratricopeptide (TPR) repeat protein